MAGTVDEYLGGFDGEMHARLLRMRELVRAAAPEAVEGMAYGIVGYRLGGRPLVYFGGFARHVGFYATPTGHEAFAAELAVYQRGKGSVRLPLDRPLPEDLITRIVDHRREQLGG